MSWSQGVLTRGLAGASPLVFVWWTRTLAGTAHQRDGAPNADGLPSRGRLGSVVSVSVAKLDHVRCTEFRRWVVSLAVF